MFRFALVGNARKMRLAWTAWTSIRRFSIRHGIHQKMSLLLQRQTTSSYSRISSSILACRYNIIAFGAIEGLFWVQCQVTSHLARCYFTFSDVVWKYLLSALSMFQVSIFRFKFFHGITEKWKKFIFTKTTILLAPEFYIAHRQCKFFQ